MTLKEHFRRNFTLAFPVVLGQLGHVMVGVADSLMVGRTGTVPLAAASLANGLFSVVLVLGIGLTFGLTPLVARADGARDHHENNALLYHSLAINLLFGLGLCALLAMALPWLLSLLGQPADVAAAAIPYTRLLLLSLPPLMIFMTYKQFAEGLSHTRAAMWVSIGANLLNVLLNYVLIFGQVGLPALGLNGAGIATVVARVVMAGLMLWLMLGAGRYAAYMRWPGWQCRQWPIARRLLAMGLPIGSQMVAEAGAFAVAAIMVGWLGATTLAAHQIALNMASVAYMMAGGIGAAATVRVGNMLGSRDPHNLRRAGFTCLGMGAAFMSVSATIFVVGRHWLPAFYSTDPVVIELAGALLVIAALFQLSDGLQVVAIGALRGLGDVRLPTLFTVIAYWVIGLPLGYALSRTSLGAAGVWYGLCAGLTAAALLMIVRFANRSRRLLRANRVAPVRLPAERTPTSP